MYKISVIIPCRNEEKYIAKCLDSVVNSDYPKDLTEVFVIDGLSTDRTISIIKRYSETYHFINLVINKKKTVPHALNLGIKISSGDFIIRLDAHAIYPEKYFSKLVKWSIKLNADNLGGIWITDVLNKNLKTAAITKVLSNRFGVGNSFFRIGIDEIAEVDTVPFGCFRREVFKKIGYFDERLIRDQDIELNKRIKKSGGRIFLVPEIFSTYYARETYGGIAKNNFQTGLWNILTVFFTKRFDSLSMRHFVPLVFVLSIFIPLLFMLWNPNFGFIALFSLTLYSFKLIFESTKISSNWKSFVYIMWAFIILHFSYGIGSLVGILRLDALFGKRPK